MKISIIVPCYNEEECINKYYDAMRPVRQKLSADFEYIFIDDGSRDGTLKSIKALAQKDKEVRYISFSRNFGKEAAIYAGLKAATGELVGLMDADLQDPPEMLLDMYKILTEDDGYDCVGCRRTTRKGESKIRSFFARMFYRLINRMSDVEIVDGARDYRLMTRKMTDAILELSERERFSKGIFGWVGFNTKWLEYKNTERVAGGSKWSFSGLTKYAVSGIEDFSTAPLKFNLILAISLFVATIGFTVFDIVWWCLDNPMYEWFIVTPIVLFVAFLLAVGLAVISEYVKKIFTEVKARPIYLVRETESDLDRDNINIECDDYTVYDTETAKKDA